MTKKCCTKSMWGNFSTVLSKNVKSSKIVKKNIKKIKYKKKFLFVELLKKRL